MSNDNDLIKVDDEFMNGDVVVLDAYPNGDLKVGLKTLSTGPNPEDYANITVSPNTTVGALRTILAAFGITLP